MRGNGQDRHEAGATGGTPNRQDFAEWMLETTGYVCKTERERASAMIQSPHRARAGGVPNGTARFHQVDRGGASASQRGRRRAPGTNAPEHCEQNILVPHGGGS
jgi:hypothetical protein